MKVRISARDFVDQTTPSFPLTASLLFLRSRSTEDCLWSTLGGTTSIVGRAVPSDYLAAGVTLQPNIKDICTALRQEIDWPVAHEVDQDRPVGVTLLEGEVVDTQEARGRTVLSVDQAHDAQDELDGVLSNLQVPG